MKIKQMQRTAAARAATKRIRLAMPPEARTSLGLRLLAILAGKRSQQSYRMRGIVNPCSAANSARIANCARRRADMSALNQREELDRNYPVNANASKSAPAPARSKVNVGW